MFFIVISFIIAYFFAMNIGASGAAASMGIAYGAGAISKKKALLVCGVGIVLGGIIGGENVVKTIGKGIVPSDVMSVQIVMIILLAATLSLFAANVIGIPLSTSEVTVGSVVGVGIAFQVLYIKNLITVVSFWIIVPFLAFLLAYITGKILARFQKQVSLKVTKWRKFLIFCLIFSGFLEAFSAGMNNVGNAIGPLVGAGLISITPGIITGALFVALGAILFGGKVVETNGKKITNISIPQGIAISSVSAGLVIGASIYGIPMPLTQVTTSAIVGIGAAEKGALDGQRDIILKIAKVWLVSPIFSLVFSYGLIQLFILKDFYSVIVVICVILATVGTFSLAKSVKREKRTVHEQGGGI